MMNDKAFDELMDWLDDLPVNENVTVTEDLEDLLDCIGGN